MEQIVSFCDKTIEEITVKINNTESILKNSCRKKIRRKKENNYTKWNTTKNILHQRKCKKYNSLQYKPTKKLLKKQVNTENRTYAEVTRAVRNLTRRLSKANNAVNKRNENIPEKLRPISPTNWFRRQGKI